MSLDVREFTNFVSNVGDLVTNQNAIKTARCKFLAKYLTELGARAILVEREYTDGGYLVDYSNYYARCHAEYPRTTTRLHFFTLPPEAVREEFSAIFASKGTDTALQQAYLGFVVLKPLPLTIVGRTCLRTYPESGSNSGHTRCYPIRRRYTAHVYGARLSVDSIAFQEQDSEVAACSTAAIWYSMHALPGKFTTQEILSPYEITSSGSTTYIRRNLGEVTRRFPTSGLALEQIEAYFRSHGLECIVAGMRPENMLRQLKEALATFSRAGLPMVVVGTLYASSERDGPYAPQGLHAVTSLGYAYNPAFQAGDWSERLARLFAHDDNVGPFSSFSFATCAAGEFPNGRARGHTDGLEVTELIEAFQRGSKDDDLAQRVTGYLMNESGTAESGFAFRKLVPFYYLIPVDPKIRFPYETVYLFGQQLARIWAEFAPLSYEPGRSVPDLCSSVRLLTAGEYQQYLVGSKSIARENVEAQVSYPGPRLLWVLGLTMDAGDGPESELFEVIFDATALRQSGGLMTLLPHDTPQAETFLSVMLRTMRGQKMNLLKSALHELRPVIEEFAVHLEQAVMS